MYLSIKIGIMTLFIDLNYLFIFLWMFWSCHWFIHSFGPPNTGFSPFHLMSWQSIYVYFRIFLGWCKMCLWCLVPGGGIQYKGHPAVSIGYPESAIAPIVFRCAFIYQIHESLGLADATTKYVDFKEHTLLSKKIYTISWGWRWETCYCCLWLGLPFFQVTIITSRINNVVRLRTFAFLFLHYEYSHIPSWTCIGNIKML